MNIAGKERTKSSMLTLMHISICLANEIGAPKGTPLINIGRAISPTVEGQGRSTGAEGNNKSTGAEGQSKTKTPPAAAGSAVPTSAGPSGWY